jgi:predicted RecA/RadA family phage recombinase
MATPVATYSHEGFTIQYTPSADVAAGDVVDLGSCVGIALRDIPANTLGSLALEGVFDVAKDTNAISLWAPVYWFATSKFGSATSSAADATMGKCIKAALAGDATVRVKLAFTAA